MRSATTSARQAGARTRAPSSRRGHTRAARLRPRASGGSSGSNSIDASTGTGTVTTQKSASIPSTLTPPALRSMCEAGSSSRTSSPRASASGSRSAPPRMRNSVATPRGRVTAGRERAVTGTRARRRMPAQLVSDEEPGAVGEPEVAHQPRGGTRVECGRGAHATRRVRETDRCRRGRASVTKRSATSAAGHADTRRRTGRQAERLRAAMSRPAPASGSRRRTRRRPRRTARRRTRGTSARGRRRGRGPRAR